jgi:hypothetical protein
MAPRGSVIALVMPFARVTGICSLAGFNGDGGAELRIEVAQLVGVRSLAHGADLGKTDLGGGVDDTGIDKYLFAYFGDHT